MIHLLLLVVHLLLLVHLLLAVHGGRAVALRGVALLHPPRLCLVMCYRDLVCVNCVRTRACERVGLSDWRCAQSRVWRSRSSKRTGKLGNRGRPGKGVAWFVMAVPPGRAGGTGDAGGFFLISCRAF